MKPIDLPCFYMNDDQQALSELDIDYDIRECEEKIVTFFSIDNVQEWVEDELNYSCIRSGGASFICPMTRKNVVNKIFQLS